MKTSRLIKAGTSGKSRVASNKYDTYIRCVEIPFKAQGTGVKLDTGIPSPRVFMPIGGYIKITVPETIGIPAQISIGLTGGGASGSIFNQEDSATIGVKGTLIQSVFDNEVPENFAFTMPSNNVEAEGVCVLWFIGGDT